MEVQAQAKLNLTLDVIGKRPDGYHDLRMIMQSVELADLLDITRSGSGGAAHVEAGVRNTAAGAD